MIPAGLAIFLHLSTLQSRRWATALSLLYVLAITHAAIFLNAAEWKNAQDFRDARQTWKIVYLATHDEAQADRRAKLILYPEPGDIVSRLQYLEEHHLNLFYEASTPALAGPIRALPAPASHQPVNTATVITARADP
jgi:hypothetical protein